MENEAPGKQEKQRKVSPNFKADDADLLLISKDNVVFRVHRLYLQANSPVFKDMFAIGSNDQLAGLPEVQLEEASEVLETCLPYVYPKRLPSFSLNLEGDFGTLKMFHKYEIARGTEAVANALNVHLAALANETSPTVLAQLATAFVLAAYIGADEVKHTAVKCIIDTSLSWQALEPNIERTVAGMLSAGSDCWKLRGLLDRRKTAIEAHRRRAGAALLQDLSHLTSPRDEVAKGKAILSIFELWEASAYLTSSVSLIAFRRSADADFRMAFQAESLYRTNGSVFKRTWQDFLSKVESLPTSLES